LCETFCPATQRGRGLPRSLECFKRAVALDEKYALAWAGLADAYNMLAWYGFVRPQASLPHAKEAATHAVAQGPSLAEAHTALAQAYSFCDWDWSNTERELLRALELNPRYVLARVWYGVWYLQAFGGRFEEGLAHVKQANAPAYAQFLAVEVLPPYDRRRGAGRVQTLLVEG
jgi:tetratricopeptide (TPR) repeat protein